MLASVVTSVIVDAVVLHSSAELMRCSTVAQCSAGTYSHIALLLITATCVLIYIHIIYTQLVSSKPVMLFMKGNPSEPRCGFSRSIVALLQEQGFEFSTFDILQVLVLLYMFAIAHC